MTNMPDGPGAFFACMIHSPSLLGAKRSRSVALIEQHIAPLCDNKKVALVTEFEASQVDASPHLQGLDMVDTDPARLPDPAFSGALRKLSSRQVSNALKHRAALQHLERELGEQQPGRRSFGIVLEDDALFTEGVAASLKRVVTLAPADADIVMLGLPSATEPPEGSTVFEDALAQFPVLPACESYLVTPKAARALAAAFLPVRFPTHVHMSYLCRRLGLKVYHSVPNVFVDGSKLGVYASAVETNNQLVWNQGFCRMSSMLAAAQAASGNASAEEKKAFEVLLDEQPFKDHPDVLAMRAKWAATCGGTPEEAEALFESALSAYDENACPVDGTSQFLRAYLDLYRQLQHAS